MQIFFPNRLWRFLKNGHLPVKLRSSASPSRGGGGRYPVHLQLETGTTFSFADQTFIKCNCSKNEKKDINCFSTEIQNAEGKLLFFSILILYLSVSFGHLYFTGTFPVQHAVFDYDFGYRHKLLVNRLLSQGYNVN